MFRKILCLILCPLIFRFSAFAMDREEIRSEYYRIVSEAADETVFEDEPDITAFRTVGRLSSAKMKNALEYVNYLRDLAGLMPVTINDLYVIRAQHAACLLAANDQISHEPEQCAGISTAMYETAFAGAAASDLACLSWYRPEILLEAISYFERDDGTNNESSLPHRRWLLNPYMSETGFGLAVSESGRSYIAMYAVDSGNDEIDWDYIAWPCKGNFPAELMRSNLAWSVSISDKVYDIDLSKPTVTLMEEVSGETFVFSSVSGSQDGTLFISTEDYGSGSCIIFKPDFSRREIKGYEQNQKWHVRIDGMKMHDDSEILIEYECDMVSLSIQRVVNVEIYPHEAVLNVGDTLTLSANIIPSYADNTKLEWICGNKSVADVDEWGNVTAVSSGTCTITARSADGTDDTCVITVK